MSSNRVICHHTKIVILASILFTLVTLACTGEQLYLTVIAEPSNGGDVFVSPLPGKDGNYAKGTHVRLEARARGGWVFERWLPSSTGCSISPQCLITVDASREVLALFKEASAVTPPPQTYVLAASPNPPEGGSVTGGGTYASGTPIAVVATPSIGWTFSGWVGACSGGGPCAVLMDSNKSVIANFTRIPMVKITVTTNVGTGTRVVVDNQELDAPATAERPIGARLRIGVPEVQPGSEGTRYAYVSWSDGPDRVHDITVTAFNQTYVATLKPQHRLSLPAGCVAATPGREGFYDVGTAVIYSCLSQESGGTRTLWRNLAPASPVPIDRPTSVTGQVVTQHKLVVSDPQGRASVSGCAEYPWCNAGESATVRSETFENAPGLSRQRFQTCNPSCTVTMSGPQTVTVSWQSQYKLTVSSGRPEATATCSNPDCWYDAGTQANAFISRADVVVGSARFTFAGWTPALPAPMNAPMSVLGLWESTSITYTLTVVCSGSGSVGPQPCGTSLSYPSGTLATLTAMAAPGWRLDAWSGACSGEGSCQVTMDANKTVTATFAVLSYILRINGQQVTGTTIPVPNGSASLSVAPNAPNNRYTYNTPVTIVSTPGQGYTGSCTPAFVTMAGDQDVNCTFAALGPHTLFINGQQVIASTVQLTGGSVLVSPAPTAAGSRYAHNTQVTLTAMSVVGWQFEEWSGACTGTGPCQVTMDGNKSVTANFTQLTVSPPTNVQASVSGSNILVTWTPPSSTGGSPITQYTVVTSPGAITATASGTTTSATIVGPTPGTSYSVTVTATNAAGVTSAPSAPSNPVVVPPSASVIVPANQYWVDSLVDVNPGESITFQASGQWSHHPSDPLFGPGGDPIRLGSACYPSPSAPLASLVASIGQDGANTAFFVRSSTPIQASRAGRVYLSINDDLCVLGGFGDNRGQMTVQIFGGRMGSPIRIAFVSTRDGNGEIYTINPDGTDQRRITNNPCFDGVPAWSPDRTKIAFSRGSCPGGGTQQIWVMNADGSSQINLTNDGSREHGGQAWSPDGRKIAYHASAPGGGAATETWTMNPDGSGKARLTSQGWSPSWFPDSSRLAFNSNRTGAHEIWIRNADGSETRLTTGGCGGWGNHTPSVSPDGQRILFICHDAPQDNIWVINVGSPGPGSRVIGNSGEDRHPSWSPGGSRIVFYSDRDGNAEIYVANADGTNQIRITSTVADDFDPGWGPP